MHSISSSFACQQGGSNQSTAEWARDLVIHPERHGVDQHVRGIVATLLIQMEAGR